jgi:hypothetical protein
MEQQYVEVDLRKGVITSGKVSAIGEAEIINLVSTVCMEKTGDEIFQIMRAAKGGFDNYFRGLYNDIYKPVYILIN